MVKCEDKGKLVLHYYIPIIYCFKTYRQNKYDYIFSLVILSMFAIDVDAQFVICRKMPLSFNDLQTNFERLRW